MAQGQVKYHLTCTYHGPLGEFDSAEQVETAAQAHFTQTHADAQGNVAPGAEVTYTAVTHLSPGESAPAAPGTR